MTHKITGISVTAPSIVQVGESFSIGLKVLTTPYYVGGDCFRQIPGLVGRYNENARGIRFMDNVLPVFAGTLEIDGGEGYKGADTVAFTGKSGIYPGDNRPIGRVEENVFTTPGTKYIRVKDPESKIVGISNPIKVTSTAPDFHLYWGDIHSQTFFSDGLRCPEELYAFARYESFLDIFAVSDHSEYLTDRQWDYFTAVTNDCYEPDVFVTLQGLEWTSAKWGHRNVYYPGESGPCLRADDDKYGDLSVLYDSARKQGAIVIPHHSANARMGVDWTKGYDAEVERLVEIYSVWGNSERSKDKGNHRPIEVLGGEVAGQHVIDALNMGRQYGIVAGGDIHDGRPGDDLHKFQEKPEMYRMLPRQGIMGVWAKSLTREDIFDALWNRRVYATTNKRIFLRFTVNGHPMGSEIRTDSDLKVLVDVASECTIERIDLVCNGENTESISSYKSPTCPEDTNIPLFHSCRNDTRGKEGDFHFPVCQYSGMCVSPDSREINWEKTVRNPGKDSYYYVRVTREDGEMAWSSPVWVKHSCL